ncbi:MAG: sarcosine oxidase subunit gamma [Rubellimicrobium sp.]|nr:sarcosine oxidase subunit gamma [Rubellimicrobium sp.]
MAEATTTVTVRDLGAQGMVTLRGDLADETLIKAVRKVTGLTVPGQRGFRRGKSGAVAWMSPDELLLLVPEDKAGSAVADLDRALDGQHHLAVDVSDARAMFAVEGPFAREVLAKCSPADLHPDSLPEGEIRRTRLGQVAAAFWCEGDGIWRVIVFRSVAGYAQALLERSARDGAVGAF